MFSWLDNRNYQNLGYWDNPFRKLTFDEFNRAFIPDHFFIDHILNYPGHILQFIGDSGYGKTSLLFQLYHHFTGKNFNGVYHHISANGIIPDLFLFCPTIIFLDEVNLANRQQLATMADIAVKAEIILIIGTHNDLEDCMPSLAKVDTFHLEVLLTGKLEKILQCSLEFSAMEKPRHQFSERSIEKLLEISKGCTEKIRSICYDIFLYKEIPPVIDEDIIETTASKLREVHVGYSEKGSTSGPDSLSR